LRQTFPRKTGVFTTNSCISHGCEIQLSCRSPPPFKVVPPSFEHGFVLPATLTRGEGGWGLTSTRPRKSHLPGLLIFRGKKAKFRGIFRGKFAEKSADFAGEKSKFAEKSADFAGF